MSDDTWIRYCDAVHKLRELEGSRRLRLARQRTNAPPPAAGVAGSLAAVQAVAGAPGSGPEPVGACKLEGVG